MISIYFHIFDISSAHHTGTCHNTVVGSVNPRNISNSCNHLYPRTLYIDFFTIAYKTTRWRNIYTGDLHLSNEGKEEGNEVDGTTGNWTIQEGEEHLYIINNKSGKKFRFALEEIE